MSTSATGVREPQRQEQLDVAARAAWARRDDVAGEYLRRELEQSRLESAVACDAQRGNGKAERERYGEHARHHENRFSHVLIRRRGV